MKKWILIIAVVVVGATFSRELWRWGVCHQYVDKGHSLVLLSKMGPAAPKDSYANEEQSGVIKNILGPGRHFPNPIYYGCQDVPDVLTKPGNIRRVTNKLGKDLPNGRFLANADEKGMWQRVLVPGAQRINPFGQEVKDEEPATRVPPGYVGVQTLREGEKKGILDTVLQAGVYYINPMELRVDTVEVGYRELSITTEVQTKEITLSGSTKVTAEAPVQGTGVSFPLSDGNQMYVDVTCIWGIWAQDAPRIIREYGSIDNVENNIIVPQLLSICKNNGSNLTTRQFIEGLSRDDFQHKVTVDLQTMGQQKGIKVSTVLVRGFHPDPLIMATIQARIVAEEEKNTLAIEQDRDTVRANLEQAERKVGVTIHDFDAETTALVAVELEVGQKKAAEIKKSADRQVAAVLAQAAETQKEAALIRGRAEAEVIEAKKKAEASKLQFLIDAYGGPIPYRTAQFAQNLPTDLDIEFRYAGPGTFWTNSTDIQELAAKRLLAEPATPQEKQSGK